MSLLAKDIYFIGENRWIDLIDSSILSLRYQLQRSFSQKVFFVVFHYS